MVAFKIYSLNNFQVYNKVLLAIITMLYFRHPELIFNNCSLYLLIPFTHPPPTPASSNHQSSL